MIAANRSRSSCSLEEALAGLRAEWGIQARPVAALVRLLDGGAPVSTGRLVAETALSHRSVTEILQRLEPWLETGPQGHRLKQKPPSPPDPPHEIRTPGHPQRSEEGGVPRFHGEGEGRGGGDPDLERRLAQLQVPRRRRHLDHVAATSDTRLRRARLLAERYDLDGAGVLCLGDHDLTSLALALVAPRAHVAVVDVDDEVLEHVDRSARALGVEVCCRFADLRLGLPSDLRGTADLVFTDPPYTPEGVWLFAARGIEAMRRDHRSRLLLCYGHGDGQPALGLKVQAALHSLRLLIEEVRPGYLWRGKLLRFAQVKVAR